MHSFLLLFENKLFPALLAAKSSKARKSNKNLKSAKASLKSTASIFNWKTILPQKPSDYIPFLIFASCLITYYWVYSAGFIWDDDDYVINNPVLRDWAGLRQIWFDPTSLPQYYPLVHTTFWMEFQLWGLNPFGYHLVNVILHAFSAILVFNLLKHLGVRGALFAALLFALHTVHVESVAWVSERKNVLSGLLYLLALRSYLTWRPVGEMNSAGYKYAVLAFVFFVGALMSKSVTCSLPAVILLLVYWKRGKILKSDFISSIPFFVVGALFASYTSFLEREHVKAVGVEFDFSLVERILIAGRATWFYLGKLIFPYPISFNYIRWEIDPTSLFQWLFPIAIVTALALLFIFRNKIGRGPLVAALFFGGTLLPALGFFNIYPMRYSFVADHFQYLASLGPLCIIAAVATIATQNKVSRNVQAALAGLVLLVLGALTFQQAKVYNGHETLWRDTLKKNPSSWLAMNNLAKTLIDRGEVDEPIELLSSSLNIRPSFESHLNLGVLEFGRGQNQKALEHFNQAIALKPDQSSPYNNKAYVLMINGALGEALTSVNMAIAIDKNYPDAIATRGQIYYRLNRMKEAHEDLKRAIELNPENSGLLFLAGDAAFKSGDLVSALNFSANAIVRSNNDVNTQNLFSKVLIESVLSQTPESRVAYCQNLFSQLGEASRPGFNQLVKYLRENDMQEEGDGVSEALGL